MTRGAVMIAIRASSAPLVRSARLRQLVVDYLARFVAAQRELLFAGGALPSFAAGLAALLERLQGAADDVRVELEVALVTEGETGLEVELRAGPDRAERAWILLQPGPRE